MHLQSFASEKSSHLNPHSDSFISHPFTLPDKSKSDSQGEVMVRDEGRSDKYIYKHIESCSLCVFWHFRLIGVKSQQFLKYRGLEQAAHRDHGSAIAEAAMPSCVHQLTTCRETGLNKQGTASTAEHGGTKSQLGEQTNSSVSMVSNSSGSSTDGLCVWLTTRLYMGTVHIPLPQLKVCCHPPNPFQNCWVNN